ncbi:transposase [Acidisoma sp.]|uniref:transposase n=1 Tax=Acidisoma sp. TaxID=1872115 RepID=UPI003B00B599
MARIGRKSKRYATDLTEEDWARIEPLLPKPPKRGRKVSVDLREMLKAIRYMARRGGGWRMLPERERARGRYKRSASVRPCGAETSSASLSLFVS